MNALEGLKILVIDDDPDLCRLLFDTFSGTGAEVYSAASGPEGLRLLYEQHPSLVILDIMMPEMDGWAVCDQIRRLCDVPIIFLTALGSERDIIHGLEDYGAVDYVVKPFSPKVLVARAKVHLRQSGQAADKGHSHYGDDYLTIDLEQCRVLVRGQPIKLSATEYKLLVYLAQHANQVLTNEQILANVWGWAYQDSPEYVHVYMSHLRQKLEQNPKAPRYLLTEYGLGYRFEI